MFCRFTIPRPVTGPLSCVWSDRRVDIAQIKWGPGAEIPRVSLTAHNAAHSYGTYVQKVVFRDEEWKPGPRVFSVNHVIGQDWFDWAEYLTGSIQH